MMWLLLIYFTVGLLLFITRGGYVIRSSWGNLPMFALMLFVCVVFWPLIQRR